MDLVATSAAMAKDSLSTVIPALLNSTAVPPITTMSPPHVPDAISKLYPAITQCFVIIFSGYIAGITSMISSTQAKGIGNFVTKFALPSLLFKNMVELDFVSVNWPFLASILISKSVVFLLVVVFTLLLDRHHMNLGKAGLYAIFSTQSNDFALGYPIVKALYASNHPDFMQYIYLIAPISLVFLNPIGFVLLEIEKYRKSDPTERITRCHAVSHVMRGMLLNPIVFMTAVGIMGNFIFKQTVPPILDDILTVLGNSFSATALFYLGLGMVGKVKSQKGSALIAPALLIAAKTLFLPFLTREVVVGLDSGANSTTASDLSMFGFLYSTFPTAPSVFLYASQYGIAADTMATGMVVCTFISAPLMFISAKMVTLPIMSPEMYDPLITQTSFDVSIIGIICCVWVLAILFLSRRCRKIPHLLTVFLIISQFVGCLGMILISTMDRNVLWEHYFQFIIFFVGVLSSRCWTAMLAVGLCLLRLKGINFVRRSLIWLILFGWGLPVALTGLLLMICSRGNHGDEKNPAVQYGKDQLLVSAAVLLASIIITVVSLVITYRRDRSHGYQKLPGDEEERWNERESLLAGHEREEESQEDLERQKEEARPLMNGQVQKEAAAAGGREGGKKKGRVRKRTQKMYCIRKKDSVAVKCASCPGIACSAGRSIEDVIDWTIKEEGSEDKLTVAPPGTDLEDTIIPDNKRIRWKDETTNPPTEEELENLSSPGNVQSCRPDGDVCSSPEVLDRQGGEGGGGGEGGVEKSDDFDDVEFGGGDEDWAQHVVDPFQMTRHTVLLLLLLLSMSVGFFLCLWRVFHDSIGGIYIEMEFLDAVLNFGQGFFAFAVFGLDTNMVILPFLKKMLLAKLKSCFTGRGSSPTFRWRRLWYGVEMIHLPKPSELDNETKLTCEQFTTYHKLKCQQDLESDRRYRFRTYQQVFTGVEFVDWLIRVGLAADRPEAVAYGHRLLTGSVLMHVTKEHHFHDLPYFYKFVNFRVEEDIH